MKTKSEPLLNVDNGGRDASTGKFLPGNPGGPGNPLARSTSAFRAAIMGAVTEADITAIIKRLIKEAKAGKPWAIRELLDRTIGKPTQAVEVGGPDGQAVTLEDIVEAINIEMTDVEKLNFMERATARMKESMALQLDSET